MIRITILMSLLAFIASFAALPSGDSVTNSLGMKFKRIPAGTFTMGTPAYTPASLSQMEARGFWDESPSHGVTLSGDFFMGVCEVTLAQFRRFRPVFGSGDTLLPVRRVTWDQADSFCQWMTAHDPQGYAYRLPTEAEWEYACRAGTATRFSTGDTLVDSQANMGRTPDGAATLTAPARAGSYAPNAWGLHDMHGNVAEWCSDWYGPYADSSQTDPAGRLIGDVKVLRGGHFIPPAWEYNNVDYCRSANRSGALKDDTLSFAGFRVALAAPVAAPFLADWRGNAIWARDVSQTAFSWVPVTDTFYRYDNSHLFFLSGQWGPLYTVNGRFHVPGVTFCPNGDLLAIMYDGISESGREANAVLSRLRAGNSEWDTVSLFMTIPDMCMGAHTVFTDSRGTIWMFGEAGTQGWQGTLYFRTSADNGVTWSEPGIIVSERKVAYTVPCSAFESPDGNILFLVVHNDNNSKLFYTLDRGATWRLTAGSLTGIRAATVMLADGRIVGLARGGAINGFMPKSVSTDTGRTFTVSASPFPAMGIGTSPVMRRLSNDAIVLGGRDDAAGSVTGSANAYYAALSYDGGETWPHVRQTGIIGQAAAAVSPNNLVCIYGTYSGTQSGGDAVFNEEWLKQGQPMGTVMNIAAGRKSAFCLKNVPNPFASSTMIEYSGATPAALAIYRLDGRKVRDFNLRERITWDGRDTQGRAVPSGCYISRLKAGNGKVLEHRLLLLK